MVGVVVLAFFAVAFFALVVVLTFTWVVAGAWCVGKAMWGKRGKARQAAVVPIPQPGPADEPGVAAGIVSAGARVAHSDGRDRRSPAAAGGKPGRKAR